MTFEPRPDDELQRFDAHLSSERHLRLEWLVLEEAGSLARTFGEKKYLTVDGKEHIRSIYSLDDCTIYVEEHVDNQRFTILILNGDKTIWHADNSRSTGSDHRVFAKIEAAYTNAQKERFPLKRGLTQYLN